MTRNFFILLFILAHFEVQKLKLNSRQGGHSARANHPDFVKSRIDNRSSTEGMEPNRINVAYRNHLSNSPNPTRATTQSSPGGSSTALNIIPARTIPTNPPPQKDIRQHYPQRTLHTTPRNQSTEEITKLTSQTPTDTPYKYCGSNMHSRARDSGSHDSTGYFRVPGRSRGPRRRVRIGHTPGPFTR